MFESVVLSIEMLHSNICMHAVPNLSCKFYKETLGAHGQPPATLRVFGSSDGFLQLRAWSAGPHSFVVNICNSWCHLRILFPHVILIFPRVCRRMSSVTETSTVTFLLSHNLLLKSNFNFNPWLCKSVSLLIFQDSECLKVLRSPLKWCTQTFICMQYQTFPQILQGNPWGASPTHCNS